MPKPEVLRRSSIPVLVLTGFLGSGKTTLLNRLVRLPALRRTLVLINEFGEIGLDHHLIGASQDETVVEMSSGCLCCTIRSDLAQTLCDAPARFARNGESWFDRVVIETTGLADPAPILQTLMTAPGVAARYVLQGVIATVDSVNGFRTLDRHPESVKQAAVADRLILTKGDLAASGSRQALEARLRRLNPGAGMLALTAEAPLPADLLEIDCFDPGMKTPDVQAWLNSESYAVPHVHEPGHTGHDVFATAHVHDVNRHDDRIRAFCVRYDDPISAVAFESWLAMLTTVRGEDLLRIKGIVHLRGVDRPAVIHGVQHVIHPVAMLDKWPSDDHSTRIVFITRDVDRATIESTLAAFAGAGA